MIKMLTIRSEQLDLLGQSQEENFILFLKDFLRAYFNEETKSESDEILIARIKTQFSNARQWGITAEKDIVDFSSLCILFGDDFCNNPNYPWAKAILNDPGIKTGKGRMLRLMDQAKKHLDNE